MKRKKIIIIIAIILLIVIIAGIIIVKNKESKGTEKQILKVNEVTRSVFYAPQYVAIGERLF